MKSLDDLISEANGKPTLNEVQADALAKKAAEDAAKRAGFPVWMNAQQRKALRKTLAKSGVPLPAAND